MTIVTSSRYDLGPSEVLRRTAAFLDRHPEPAGRFLAAVTGPGDPLADVGRTVEREVFEERFGNTTSVMTAEYAAYEADSRFIVVLDRERGLPAGAARMIDGGRHGTKAMHDAPAAIGRSAAEICAAHGMDDDAPVREFATVVVLPEYRGKRSALQVSTLLYRAFIRLSTADGVRHVVAMLDRAAYRNVIGLGTPFVAMAGSAPFQYLGSSGTHALYGFLPDFETSIGAQAARLRRSSRPAGAEVRNTDLRKYAVRRVAADVAGRLASGEGLDERILTAG
jgi:hypothetical protein